MACASGTIAATRSRVVSSQGRLGLTMAWSIPRSASSARWARKRAPVSVRVDEGGHRLLDGAVVAADVFTVGPEDFELVLQVVGVTGAGKVEQVAHVAVAGDKPQGFSLAAAGDQNRRVRVLQRVGRVERPEQLVVGSLVGRLVSAPHLQGDLDHFLQPLEPFGQRREWYSQPVGFEVAGRAPGWQLVERARRRRRRR